MALLSRGTANASSKSPRPAWLGVVAAGAAALAGAAVLNNEMAKRAERRHPPKGKFVEVDGVRLHYLERGAGPTIVLVHGNSVMAEDYDISGVMGLLAADHRVIAFDRPGFGYSERPRGTLWTPEAQAALLRRALQRIGVDRSVVVGHSWGSMVALAMALDTPTAVSAVVLMSGYYYPTVRADVPMALLPAIPGVGDILRYSVSPLTALLMGPAIFKKTFAPAPVSDRFKRRFPLAMTARPSQVRAEAADAGLMIPGAAAMHERHGELRMPVMIVAGSDDKIVATEQQSVRLHNDVGHSRLRKLTGVGHMVHHIAPEQVVDAIREASAAVSPPAARKVA